MAAMSQLPPPPPPPLHFLGGGYSGTSSSDFTTTFNDEPMLTSFSNHHHHLPLPPPDLHSLDPDSSLLSNSESNSFFGFLENFEWDFDPVLPVGLPVFSNSASLDNPTTTIPDDDIHNIPRSPTPPNRRKSQESRRPSSKASSATSTSSPPHHHHLHHPHHPHHPHHHPHNTSRNKPLLSTPQKRLNHIMSEQKRRNAIRDGYATLNNILAPAGAPIGSGLPTRGRPKGSGSRAKTAGAKGKSGVLFRAVEYCKWLEEGCEALRREVERIELAAGIDGNVDL